MENVFIILFLIFFFSTLAAFIRPQMVFKDKPEPEVKKTKIAMIVLTIVFFILFGVTSDAAKQKGTQVNQDVQTASIKAIQPSPITIPNTPTQTKSITYEVVKSWKIPNGGEGKLVVISPDLVNETEMLALGEKLKEDTKRDRNANISVYTNTKAANLRERLSSETNPLTKEEDEYYNTHFIAQYDRNINTGYHQFTIYFDGVMGTNHKTIKY